MTKHTVTIELPTRTLFKTVKGEASYIEWDKVPADVVAQIVVGGGLIISNNSYNGAGGKDRKQMTDEQKLAIAMKRIDGWYRGSYTTLDRADNQTALMREAYLSEVLAGDLTPAKVKAVEAKMKATVKDVLGDVNATFDNFLDALATLKSKTVGEARTQGELKVLLDAKYAAMADDIAMKRAKEAAEVDVDLTDFEI